MSWISYLVGILGALVGLAGWLRNNKGDTAEQARWMGRIDEKLENIGRSLTCLDGIPQRMKMVEDQLAVIDKKLVLRPLQKSWNSARNFCSWQGAGAQATLRDTPSA